MISLIKRLIVTSTITLLLIGSPQFIFASQATYNEKINEQHIEFKEEIEELEQPDKQGVQEYIDSELNEEENKLIEQKPDEDNMISIKSTKSAPKFTVGDSGPHVKELKNNLRALGYGNFPANPSNVYGTVTANVVKDFQKNNGLNATGNADKETLDFIEVLLNFHMSSKEIVQLKKDLKALGFGNFPANPSGAYGTVTKNVVKQFQSYAKLPQTGIADQATLNKIKEVLNPPYKPGDRGVAVTQLKKDLRQLGYGNFPANPSNVYGTVTANVVKDFQSANGLKDDGITDQQTLDKISELVNNISIEPVIKTEYTNYKLTLVEAVNIQLSHNPQTDKYRNDKSYIANKYVTLKGRGTVTGTVNVRTKPTVNSDIINQMKKSNTVNVIKEVNDIILGASNKWYQISNNGKLYYISSKYVDINEGEVLATVNVRAGQNTSSHIFGKLLKGDKITIKNKEGSWYEIEYKTWRLPTASDLSSEMNPKNTDKFQHLRLDTLAGATASQLNGMLKGKGVLNNQGQAFINGAKQGKVNEAYLISHSLLETGNGTSKLATGIEVGKNKSGKPTVVTSSNRKNLTSIKKVYNMYGIGAVDSNPNNAGAIRAYEEGWTTPKKAIEGGAKWVGQQYIHNAYKQNTLYKMRWNPRMAEGYAWKQYATDIGWARKQISRIKEVYSFIDRPNYHYDIAEYN